MNNTTLLLLYFWGIVVLCTSVNAQHQVSQRDKLLSQIRGFRQDTFRVNALLQLADYYYYINNDSAVYYAKKAISLSRAIGFQTGLGEGYIRLAMGFAYVSQNEEGLKTALSAQDIFLKLGRLGRQAVCLQMAAENLSKMGKLDDAERYARRGLRISEAQNDNKNAASCYNVLGVVFQTRGAVDSSIHYFEKVMLLSSKFDDKDIYSGAMLNIANCYFTKGLYAKALEYYQLVIKESQKKGNKKNIGSCYSNIGNIYSIKKQYDKALVYFNLALPIFTELKDTSYTVTVLGNIASVHALKGEYQIALEENLKCLSLLESSNDELGKSYILNNIGDAYRELKDYPNALKHQTASLRISKEIGDEAGSLYAGGGLALIYLAMGDPDKALPFAEEGYEVAKRLSVGEREANFAHSLSLIYEAKKNYSKALEYFKIYNSSTDSLNKIENELELGRLESNFEYEKKIAMLELEKKAQRYENEKQESQRRFSLTVFGIVFLGLATIIGILVVNHKRISAARRVAQNANLAKSEFLANMSHEIRTPLNGVIGFADLLSKTAIADNQKQYVSTIYQSAHSLLDIINDILDFSKIEAGKLELLEHPTHLEELCNSVETAVSFQVLNKGLVYTYLSLGNGPQYVYLDDVRLRQVLINLVGNAVKFTDTGKVELKVEWLGVRSADMNMYRFSVTDTGMGINAQNQARIFEAFSQEDASTTRKYGGTGLGLSISNKLLGLMGSKLQLQSEVGKGSTFFFELVLKKAEVLSASLDSQNNLSLRSTKQIDLSQTPSILIAEDNAINMLLTKKILLRCLPEAKLFEANNGLEAVEVFKKHRIDLIFMDVQMPEMNGYEATRAIRALDTGKDTYIVALTAGNVMGERETCLKEGMNDFVSKPIVNGALECILEKWLSLGTV